jgi:hypothetical protein
MQTNFTLALMTAIHFDDRRNSQRSNWFLLLDFLLSANRLTKKTDLLLLTSKQITTHISQPKSYSHLSKVP